MRYVPGVNAAASPYRFDLRMDDPEVWFLEDDGFELAVFHSHLSSPARPSRTDVRNIGMWEGKPYVIYTVRTGELAAWRIVARCDRAAATHPGARHRGGDARGSPPVPPISVAPGSADRERARHLRWSADRRRTCTCLPRARP